VCVCVSHVFRDIVRDRRVPVTAPSNVQDSVVTEVVCSACMSCKNVECISFVFHVWMFSLITCIAFVVRIIPDILLLFFFMGINVNFVKSSDFL